MANFVVRNFSVSMKYDYCRNLTGQSRLLPRPLVRVLFEAQVKQHISAEPRLVFERPARDEQSHLNMNECLLVDLCLLGNTSNGIHNIFDVSMIPICHGFNCVCTSKIMH